ncbi:MAG: glycosyltransferase family 4 protein [Phycisphaerales bacterium]|nr:glycosyltransferase family 4 protein [Phycisphaerales bacterium]
MKSPTLATGAASRLVQNESIPAEPGATIDLDALAASVRQWHDEGGVAVACGPLDAGPWLDLFNAFVLAQVAACGARQIRHDAPLWVLHSDGPIPQLNRAVAVPTGDCLAVIPTSRQNITARAMMWLRRAGIRRLWLLTDRGWSLEDSSEVLADLLARRRIKPLLRRLAPGLLVDSAAIGRGLGRWLSQRAHGAEPREAQLIQPLATSAGRDAEVIWREAIDADNATFEPPRRSGGPLRVVQYTGCLYSGGAERQLCNTAIGLHQRGHVCTVRTQHDLDDEHGHYLPLLAQHRIDAGRAGRGRQVNSEALAKVRWDLVAVAPQAIRSYVANLAMELAADPPDVLHAWLDHPNVIAALAGVAAGVPCILLSTRNYNPTHFPRFYLPFVDWYRVVGSSRRVHWLANSHRGAASYAEYVGIEESRFHIVFNGLFRDHFDRPTPAQRRQARQRLGLPAEAPVVAVVNRLDEEKQPELMLKVITLLRERLPNVRVIVAGSGPLEGRVREIIARRNLEQTVTLLGRVSDVVGIMSAADVLLLTSRYEGCPNVALEAQHVGVPVVATDAGGTSDAVSHGVTGYICGVDDVAALVIGLQRLLASSALREQFGVAAQEYVDACFNLDLMVDLTCCVYERALSGMERGGRVETPRPRRQAPAATPAAFEDEKSAPTVQTIRPAAVRT